MVYAYLRTSGEINPDDSIDNQRKFIEEYADEHNLEVIEYLIDEKKTGMNENRESFQRLKKLVKSNMVGLILVPYFDRLGRNQFELALFLMQLKARGIECISIGENKRLSGMTETEIVNISSTAEVENRNRTERLKNARQNLTEQGIHAVGRVPIGYKKNKEGKLIKSNDAKFVQEVFLKFIELKSVSKVTKFLQGQEKWQHINISKSFIHRILERKNYTGYLYRPERDEKGNLRYIQLSHQKHQEIISEETFNQVYQILNKKESGSKKRQRNFYPFSGIIFCGRCLNKLYPLNEAYNCKVCKLRCMMKYLDPLLIGFLISQEPPSTQGNKEELEQQVERIKDSQAQLEVQYATLKISKWSFEERMFKLGEEMKNLYKSHKEKLYDVQPFSMLIKEQDYVSLKKEMIRREIKIKVNKKSKQEFTLDLMD